MANITGTNGADILNGTSDDDTILGLAGNDQIIGGGSNSSNDVIDGGTGNDVLDYSNVVDFLGLNFDAAGSLTMNKFGRQDKILNIETIIVSPNSGNSISPIDFAPGSGLKIDVDLSENRFTYSSDSFSAKTITIKNFRNISAPIGNSRFKGDDGDNRFDGNRGDDIVVGSKGNDLLLGGGGKNTLDYTNIGHAVKLLPAASVAKFGPRSPAFIETGFSVEKQGIGTDKLFNFSKIIGTINKKNTIDASLDSTLQNKNNLVSIDLNLATNSLKLNAPESPESSNYRTYETVEVINFTNVIGSRLNDTIVGANKNSELTGGGGNDTITGGNKNDIITGSDSTARGVGEVDILTGGGGRDKFILGDKNGAYYVGKGNYDYAMITDFNLFQDSISIGSLKDYSFAADGNNTIDLYSGKDVKTRDLIAKIQIAGGISAASSNSRSIVGSSLNLDAIISKMDIISGTNPTG